MLIISEKCAESVVDRNNAFSAVEAAFAAMATGEAKNFPVVREQLGYADAVYGFKSGFNRSKPTLGVKAGGYWPGNTSNGLTNHQSTIVLFDPNSGEPTAFVAGNYLTAMRTAASSAISIKHLARGDAEVLGIIGAGQQAPYQLRAALDQRKFLKIIAWNLHPEGIDRLSKIAADHNIPFENLTLEEVCFQSDVLLTITSSFEPFVDAQWITRGTHIACMGTDTVGKQELDAELVSQSQLFTDEVQQSITIGEFQHAYGLDAKVADKITTIGDAINGAHPGRVSDDQVTIFDGTGVGLQDIAVAAIAAELADKSGLAGIVEI